MRHLHQIVQPDIEHSRNARIERLQKSKIQTISSLSFFYVNEGNSLACLCNKFYIF
jgi:hypothetical protein